MASLTRSSPSVRCTTRSWLAILGTQKSFCFLVFWRHDLQRFNKLFYRLRHKNVDLRNCSLQTTINLLNGPLMHSFLWCLPCQLDNTGEKDRARRRSAHLWSPLPVCSCGTNCTDFTASSCDWRADTFPICSTMRFVASFFEMVLTTSTTSFTTCDTGLSTVRVRSASSTILRS